MPSGQQHRCGIIKSSPCVLIQWLIAATWALVSYPFEENLLSQIYPPFHKLHRFFRLTFSYPTGSKMMMQDWKYENFLWWAYVCSHQRTFSYFIPANILVSAYTELQHLMPPRWVCRPEVHGRDPWLCMGYMKCMWCHSNYRANSVHVMIGEHSAKTVEPSANK
jgi:hypothetical protein